MVNPQQISIEIQAVFDIVGGAASTADNISSALSHINSENALTIISDTGQTISAAVSLTAAVFGGAIFGPEIVLGTAAVAATITIAKNINDISSVPTSVIGEQAEFAQFLWQTFWCVV